VNLTLLLGSKTLKILEMTRFSRRWSNENQSKRGGFTKRFRNRINPPPPLKVTIEKAEKSIHNQLYRLDMLLTKLKEKDSKLIQRITRKIRRQDKQHASILANELVEIRKMMRMVGQARYALEAIALRLETVRDLGDIVVNLAPAVAAVKNVHRGIAGVIPTAEDSFTEITGLLSDILVDAGQSREANLDFKLANEDAEKILAEASVMAEESLRQKIPDIPANLPKSLSATLEEVLI
jgi:division protein CdvB (Snf7/Vps24/ESCRT-III family)